MGRRVFHTSSYSHDVIGEYHNLVRCTAVTVTE